MDNPNCSTEHQKGQHLTAEERHNIEVHLKDGWSRYKIAKQLNRPFNTVKNEIARGTVALYDGTVLRYKADAGQQRYNENRRSSTRTYRCLETTAFRQVIKSATINPAREIGADKEIGSIEVGKKADFVVLDSSFNIKMVFTGGKIAYRC